MLSTIFLVFSLVSLFYGFSCYRALMRNIAASKLSGIRYVVLPFNVFSLLWMMIHPVVLPLLERLPKAWTESWIAFMNPDWAWLERYEPFRKLGTDSVLVVSSGQTWLWTCSAEAISQITSRRNDFPKPVEIYQLVLVYGPNILASDGAMWRRHRKISAPSFTEKNNELVWSESLIQSGDMLASWLGADKRGVVTNPGRETMRLSLHVLCRAAFGMRLLWPGLERVTQTQPSQGSHLGDKDELDSSVVPPGHTLSYKDALETLLQSIWWIILLPHSILKRSPLRMHKKSWQGYLEWLQWMTEMIERKKEDLRQGRVRGKVDLLGALLNDGNTPRSSDQKELNGYDEKATGQVLSDEELMGNAFAFLLAGHETVANTIHYSLLFLALNSSSQVRLQHELDDLSRGRKSSEWTYDEDMPKLFEGMAGAVLNETLRVMPTATWVPKCTKIPQPLTIEGRQVTIPANCYVGIDIAGAHRNPKYWSVTAQTSDPNDVSQFRPERWFVDSTKSANSTVLNAQHDGFEPTHDDDPVEGPTGSETASTLFRPVRGSYVPFSDGARSCIGRRFAQVEILATLASIFQEYSIELDVREFASDEEVERMPLGGEERQRVWNKAKERADWLMWKGMATVVTLQMRKGAVPLRIVRRGEERFRFGMD